jgi:hypothetical protein
MQVTMWVIFGGSLGLAQLVVRQRQHMPITLDPRTRLGPLWVQLPQGWTTNDGQEVEPGQLQVVDPDETEELTISVQRTPDGEKGGQDADQPGAGTQPIYFKGLNRQGLMAAVPQKMRTPEGGVVTREMLLAVTDLPSGYELEIWLSQGRGKIGAGERRIVEAVANGITWAGVPPSVKRHPPMPPGPILFY